MREERLNRRLNILIRRKKSAPSYQKELIQREINRTRQLLKSVYGQDTEQAPLKKKAAIIGVVSMAMLILYAGLRKIGIGSRSINSGYGRRGYRPMGNFGKYKEWTDIQSTYPEFYEKARLAFRGYNGEFEGLNLQDFIRSLDSQYLASASLMSPTFRMFNPQEKERVQLEAVLLSIVRPNAAQKIPNIETLREMHHVKLRR